MTELWDERAQAYRDSKTHAEGADLDLVVEWCAPGPGRKVLDVATGGGHVATASSRGSRRTTSQMSATRSGRWRASPTTSS
jgi:tRNA1(Val) A37 N6-methylase TrmN6